MQLVIEDVERIESISLQTGVLTDKEFECLFERYEEFRVELFADGELILMPPAGPETARRNSRITRLLDEWAEADGGGIAFDSSAYFYLPNGARLSPDACWIRKSRSLRGDERPWSICPDFVIELRSDSDRLVQLRKKMSAWMEGGALLGWLVDPKARSVTVYRPHSQPEILMNITVVRGEGLVSGFELNLDSIFS